MIRMLRIVGIVVFALLAGISANSLGRMHSDGVLFQEYNSQRKSNATLLVSSLLALGLLGWFEVLRLRKASERRGYGGMHGREEPPRAAVAREASSIYAAPETVDEWDGRKVRSNRTRKHAPRREMHELWMWLLRILGITLPIVYLGAFAYLFMQGFDNALEAWLGLSLVSGLVLASAVFSLGVFKRKAWGLSCGYLLAIVNLVVFPIGTAVGLLLLIGLVGAASGFSQGIKSRNRAGSLA